MQLRDAGKSGSQLSSCRKIPQESNIYAHLVNMASQRHLKISRLYCASNATEQGPVCCQDKAHFPISCWQYDGACFSSCLASRDVAIGYLPERLSVCSPYSWLCTFLSHCVSTIHIILSTIFSRLYILMHYFIIFALSSKPCRSSLHMSVLTDSLGQSRHEEWGNCVPDLAIYMAGWRWDSTHS